MDVDVMVERNIEKLHKLVKILKKKGFDVIQRDVDEAFKESSHFSVFSKDSPYYFDFKVVSEDEEQFFERVKPITLYNRRTFLPAPEDLIVYKIIYGTEQDINDVKSIIKRLRRKLDYNHLFKLAETKKVLARLKCLLKETS